MSLTRNSEKIIELIRSLGQKHSSWQVFEDFLAMSAISISNAIDWIHREDREQQYLSTVKRYTKEELDLFPEMFALLVEELEFYAELPQDVLGPMFHELELHNKYTGQFFTPVPVCEAMGMMTLGDCAQKLKDKGFLTVGEPAAGSGAMALGLAKAIKQNGYDFHRHLVVTATDIDLKCVYMSYLQLSLYGVPAVVIHGDTIQMKEWSRWYTPVYLFDGWMWKQECGTPRNETEAITRVSEPLYAALKDATKLIASNGKKLETA